MKQALARAYLGLAWLILAGVLLQFFFVGLAIFGVMDFGPHVMLGLLMALLSLILLVLALAGRLGGGAIRPAAILFGLMLVQMLLVRQLRLANLGDVSRVIAALHPVNALAILFFAHEVARAGRRISAAPMPAATATTGTDRATDLQADTTP